MPKIKRTIVPVTPDNDRLHSVESAAAYLGGVSPWTIRAWLEQGRLKRTKVGARVFIRESSLRQMIRDEEEIWRSK